ncbi:MAG: flagellin [Gemmatimonadales bacterium]|nr:MAG: flagellin [Gemmatimonadales bacterium]
MSRINTNVASLNAQRNISQTNQAFGRTVGRLSSGFRINRAADDAAGLGIANKLRSDIRALNQASQNASQANSLLQVAEGATNQISGIVDRMKELAAQSASDSVNDTGRALIQAEFGELQAELTRIVDTTKFQGTSLLAGGGTTEDVTVTTGLTGGTDGVETTLDAIANISAAAVTVGDAAALEEGGYTISAAVVDPGSGDVLRFTLSDGTDSTTFDVNLDTGDVDGAQTVNLTLGTLSVEFEVADGAAAATVVTDVDTVSIGVETATESTTVPTSLQFLVSVSGSAGSGEDFVSLNVQDLTLANLGLDASSLATREAAVAAIDALDAAIDSISTSMGDIGAAQNRIDFASANVASTIENFSAAESVIRDADFAAEASEFARLQILQQSQIAMLAQANAAPQGVLQLLG